MNVVGDSGYERTKVLIVAVFIVYAFVGLSAEAYYRLSGRVQPPDIFPFFTWSMFAHVPNTHETYAVRIHVFGERSYTPPIDLVDSGPMLMRRHRVTDYVIRTAAELGRAIERDNPEEIERARHTFESVFRDGRFRYDVLRVTKDPYRFWHSRTYDSETLLATFSS